MSDEYFKKALANFTNDFASGGAIRHLADNGFTVKEIHARLDFPTPMSKVAETVWNHFLDKGVILTQEPAKGEITEKIDYVKVQGEFLRAETVAIADTERRIIARGLTRYSSEEIELILGKKSEDIETILGFTHGDVVIHRDDLALA